MSLYERIVLNEGMSGAMQKVYTAIAENPGKYFGYVNKSGKLYGANKQGIRPMTVDALSTRGLVIGKPTGKQDKDGNDIVRLFVAGAQGQ